MQEEAELGHEIDYISRYIAEGGLTGERKRWVPRRGKTPLDPDAEGFAYSNPLETSFKQRCLEEWRIHNRKFLKTLRNEGPGVLGNVSESDYIRVEERLKKIMKGPEQNTLKPKAASKMIVSELKEESWKLKVCQLMALEMYSISVYPLWKRKKKRWMKSWMS